MLFRYATCCCLIFMFGCGDQKPNTESPKKAISVSQKHPEEALLEIANELIDIQLSLLPQKPKTKKELYEKLGQFMKPGKKLDQTVEKNFQQHKSTFERIHDLKSASPEEKIEFLNSYFEKVGSYYSNMPKDNMAPEILKYVALYKRWNDAKTDKKS